MANEGSTGVNVGGVTWMRLQHRLLRFSFFNLLLVAFLGVTLRLHPLLAHFPLLYKNLLHGHSHFAFGGWVLPVTIALVMGAFPEVRERIAVRHWRNIGLLALVSAYGMLVFFPLYGYKGISIAFSTLSIAATVYFAVVTWKGLAALEKNTAHRFLQWGLVYVVLSSVGPFATVPLILSGQQGSHLYFDVIYFYLHFQYNGFFVFAVLALLYRRLPAAPRRGRTAFLLLNLACIPTYALSVLWHQPPLVFHFIGGAGALLQVAAIVFLWRDARSLEKTTLLRLSLVALTLKILLQLVGAAPAVAVLAYDVRHFVIAYLHLVLLGVVSLYFFDETARQVGSNKFFRVGIACFLASFFATEGLLGAQAALISNGSGFMPFQLLILAFSLFFPLGVALMLLGVHRACAAAYRSLRLNDRMASNSGTVIQTSNTPSV